MTSVPTVSTVMSEVRGTASGSVASVGSFVYLTLPPVGLLNLKLALAVGEFISKTNKYLSF